MLLNPEANSRTERLKIKAKMLEEIAERHRALEENPLPAPKPIRTRDPLLAQKLEQLGHPVELIT